MSFRVIILLLMLNFGLSLLPDIACAKNKEIPDLQVEGKLRTDEGGLNGATIEVCNAAGDELNQTATVDETGKFALQLAFQQNYFVIFKSKGFYSKKLILNATIPEKVLKRDPYFPPIKIIVTLFREIQEIDPSFSEKPVGKIFYSAELDNFDSESYFNDKQIREKIDEEVAATYQKKLEKAKQLEDSGNLAGAVKEYQTATSLKQEDDIVQKKIASLKEQIKQEEQVRQAEVARKENMDKQLAAVSPETAGTADNTLEAQANQSVSVQKTSGGTITKEKQNLAEQAQPDSAEVLAQTEKNQPDIEEQKAHQDSARKMTGRMQKQEAIVTTETTKPQISEQEKAQPSSVDGEDKSLAQASIQPHDNNSGSGIILISGLILFALLVLLWLRRKTKQKNVSDN